jgi:hypothetical protein
MGAISGTQPLLVTPQQSIDTLAVARAFYRA